MQFIQIPSKDSKKHRKLQDNSKAKALQIIPVLNRSNIHNPFKIQQRLMEEHKCALRHIRQHK